MAGRMGVLASPSCRFRVGVPARRLHGASAQSLTPATASLSAAQRRRVMCSGASGAMPMPGDGTPSESSPADRTYTPFPRLKESDPYRLLGISKDAGFDEVAEARRFLLVEYRWHEPSREAIELSYERIMADNLKARQASGYNSGIPGRKSIADSERDRESFGRKISNLFDPTVTLITLINEGILFIGLAFWALSSTDQSFPLAMAFAYGVYKLHSKRTKRYPDGPHFAGNPIVGAVLGTAVALGVGCAITWGLTPMLTASVVGYSVRSIGGFIVIALMGLTAVYLK